MDKLDCSTNEVDELIMHDGSPLSTYFTNALYKSSFTFDGTNIVAQFAYSEKTGGKQLFASTNMLFWENVREDCEGPINTIR